MPAGCPSGSPLADSGVIQPSAEERYWKDKPAAEPDVWDLAARDELPQVTLTYRDKPGGLGRPNRKRRRAARQGLLRRGRALIRASHRASHAETATSLGASPGNRSASAVDSAWASLARVCADGFSVPASNL